MKTCGSLSAVMLAPFSADGSFSTKGIAPLVDLVLFRGVDGRYAEGGTG